MLTVKAKHATTLLTVSDAEGLTGSVEELDGDAAKRKQSQMQTSVSSECAVSLNVNESLIVIHSFSILTLLSFQTDP